MNFVFRKGKETKHVYSDDWRIAVIDRNSPPVLQIDKVFLQINQISFEGAKEIVPYLEKEDIFAIILDVDTGNLEFWRKNNNEYDERPNKDRRIQKGSFELLQERIGQARQDDSYDKE